MKILILTTIVSFWSYSLFSQDTASKMLVSKGNQKKSSIDPKAKKFFLFSYFLGQDKGMNQQNIAEGKQFFHFPIHRHLLKKITKRHNRPWTLEIQPKLVLKYLVFQSNQIISAVFPEGSLDPANKIRNNPALLLIYNQHFFKQRF